MNRRITAAAVVTFLDTQQTTVQQSATLTTTYWLCRKTDLPVVLPPALADAVVTHQQLQELGAPAGALECIDFEAFLVLGQVVQRHMLPRGVQTASFALAAVSTYGARAEPPSQSPASTAQRVDGAYEHGQCVGGHAARGICRGGSPHGSHRRPQSEAKFVCGR